MAESMHDILKGIAERAGETYADPEWEDRFDHDEQDSEAFVAIHQNATGGMKRSIVLDPGHYASAQSGLTDEEQERFKQDMMKQFVSAGFSATSQSFLKDAMKSVAAETVFKDALRFERDARFGATIGRKITSWIRSIAS